LSQQSARSSKVADARHQASRDYTTAAYAKKAGNQRALLV
jgi:hypothetical protein